MKPKVLVFDIEISKAIFATYPNNKPQYLGYKDMIADQNWICAAWQWEDSKKINKVSVLDDMKSFRKNSYDMRCLKWHDKIVVKTLHDVINEADMVVGHNIKNFDWKHFLAKCIEYNLPPPKEVKFFDTLTMARKVRNSYNSLGFLAKKYKLENKMEAPDWDKILLGDEKEIKYCEKYCMGDIPPAIELYKIYRPYMPAQINHNLFRGDGIDCCPVCGSTNFKAHEFRYTATGKTQGYICNDCNKRFQAGKKLKGVRVK